MSVGASSPLVVGDSVDGIGAGDVTMNATVTDTTASDSVSFDPSNRSHVTYVTAGSYGLDDELLSEGGTYRNVVTVTQTDLSSDHLYDLREREGDVVRNLHWERSPDASGNLSFNLTDHEGDYVLWNDSATGSDRYVANFSVMDPSLSSASSSMTVDLADSSTATWTVDANYAGHDLVLFSPDLDRSQLLGAVPGASNHSGDVAILDASASQDITIDAEALGTGEYEFFAQSGQTDNRTQMTLTVTDSSGSTSSLSISSTGSTSDTTTTTDTTTTETETTTSSTTDTATSTSTEETVTADSSTSSSDDGGSVELQQNEQMQNSEPETDDASSTPTDGPGFGSGVTIVAIVVLAAAVARRD